MPSHDLPGTASVYQLGMRHIARQPSFQELPFSCFKESFLKFLKNFENSSNFSFEEF
jgi:hypothetical protein